MYKNKKNDKSTFGIVGVGRFGYALATELAASHAEILVIDRDEEKIRQMLEDDFKKHFANQTIQKDPYFAYETTYNQCTVNVDKENFTIRSKEFTIDFTWIDRKHQIIEDENHVLYQIYQ